MRLLTRSWRDLVDVGRPGAVGLGELNCVSGTVLAVQLAHSVQLGNGHQ